MDKRPIGMFDSGVGGLSILEETKKILPFQNFIFLADQAHVPYGAKSPKELKILTASIANFLLKSDIKMLVVACNTASCYTIDFLRKKFSIPIVGVIPAIKPAVKITQKGKIAILSTPATASSAYLKDLIGKIASNKEVLPLGCEGLEEAVENLKFKDISKLLIKYVQIVKKFGADVIVLGCTHYPFLKKEIKILAGRNTKVIDSGPAIAARIKSLLNSHQMISKSKHTDLFFTTGNPKEFSKVASTLLKYKIYGRKVLI